MRRRNRLSKAESEQDRAEEEKGQNQKAAIMKLTPKKRHDYLAALTETERTVMEAYLLAVLSDQDREAFLSPMSQEDKGHMKARLTRYGGLPASSLHRAQVRSSPFESINN